MSKVRKCKGRGVFFATSTQRDATIRKRMQGFFAQPLTYAVHHVFMVKWSARACGSSWASSFSRTEHKRCWASAAAAEAGRWISSHTRGGFQHASPCWRSLVCIFWRVVTSIPAEPRHGVGSSRSPPPCWIDNKHGRLVRESTMIILLVFAFVSGLVTILAPCIWPLLPIVLSSSSTGGTRKPLGITLGIIGSFSLFTHFRHDFEVLALIH